MRHSPEARCRTLPATRSKRNSRHSSAPLKSGVFVDSRKPHQARQLAVGREHVCAPAGKALLERIAEGNEELGVGRIRLRAGERVIFVAARARRLADFAARPRPHTPIRSPYGGFATRMPGASVGGVMLRASSCLSASSGMPARLRFARAFSSMSPEMSLPKISTRPSFGRAARFASSAPALSFCHIPG